MFEITPEVELFVTLDKVIEKWAPKQQYPNQNGYRNELMGYIRGNSTHPHVIKSEVGRGLVDIAVDETIGIEVKLDFNKKADLDKLIGQVDAYAEEYKGVIVVLCGKSNPVYVKELIARLQKIRDRSGGGLPGPETKVMLDVIEVGKPRRRLTRSMLGDFKFEGEDKKEGGIGSLFDLKLPGD